jgi:hypothetical protein
MRIIFDRSQKVPSLDFGFLNATGLDNGAYFRILGVTQNENFIVFFLRLFIHESSSGDSVCASLAAEVRTNRIACRVDE